MGRIAINKWAESKIIKLLNVIHIIEILIKLIATKVVINILGSQILQVFPSRIHLWMQKKSYTIFTFDPNTQILTGLNGPDCDFRVCGPGPTCS